jgi:hypothetical protein
MKSPRGRYLPLSWARRIGTDFLHFAQKLPTVPVQRVMNLATLREARTHSQPRISWTILFTKAYALLARDLPILRRAILDFPWQRVYEHPHSIPMIMVEREYEGETMVVGCTLRAPEETPLRTLHEQLESFRTQPPEASSQFRRSRWMARLPRFLRRWLWWAGLNISGPRRSKYFGTFAVSVYSALGAESLHPITPLTTTLNYGLIAADGSVPVRIVYDHRLIDGATIARALGQLEEILNGPICRELAQDTAAAA